MPLQPRCLFKKGIIGLAVLLFEPDLRHEVRPRPIAGGEIQDRDTLPRDSTACAAMPGRSTGPLWIRGTGIGHRQRESSLKIYVKPVLLRGSFKTLAGPRS